MRIELLAPDGSDTLVAEAGARLTIPRAEGLDAPPGEPLTVGAPGQEGETAIDHAVGLRTIALTYAYRATDYADAQAMRGRLRRALLTPPRRAGDPPRPCLLRCHPYGAPPVEIEAHARNSPHFAIQGPVGWLADVELVCPDPYFREIENRSRELSATGGFSFPIALPLVIATYNGEVRIVNGGEVATPVVIRFHGPATTPRLRNVTTGQRLEIAGDIPAGARVDVETAFGRKAVTLTGVNGLPENIMGRVSRAFGDFWHLVPGDNIVRYEADINQSGRALFWWCQRVAGVG